MCGCFMRETADLILMNFDVLNPRNDSDVEKNFVHHSYRFCA